MVGFPLTLTRFYLSIQYYANLSGTAMILTHTASSVEPVVPGLWPPERFFQREAMACLGLRPLVLIVFMNAATLLGTVDRHATQRQALSRWLGRGFVTVSGTPSTVHVL